MLKDWANYDRLSGVLDGHFTLQAIGATQHAMVNSLSGGGDFHLKDGKLKGVNLAALVRNFRGAAQAGSDQSTDFSDLSGTFVMKNGVATNNDLAMNSPLLRMSGVGTVDLPNWQVQYLLQPKLVSSIEGQGGKDAEGIVIPVRVDGPLDNPHYHPDLQAALKQNPKVQDAVNRLKGNAGKALQNLLR